MPDLLKKSSELCDTTMAVIQRPSVREARRALDEARVPYNTAKGRLDAIDKTLAPITSSATSPHESFDELVLQQARADLLEAQRAFWKAEIIFRIAERTYQKVVEAETRNVTDERVHPRRALITMLFERLDKAVAMAEQIQAYDDKTRELGGVPPLPPVCELLSDTYRQSFVEANRSVLLKERWL